MLPLIARDAEYRARSNRILCYSFLAAMVLYILAFRFFPPFEFKPYVLRDYQPIELIYPEEYELPPLPKAIAQPAVPIEPADESEVGEETVEEIEVPPNVYKNLDEMPALAGVGSGKAQKTFTYSEFDKAPVLIESVEPTYPELAKQAGIEGSVLLRLLIGENGKVISASIIQSDVTPAMEKAAIAAARQFRFKPAQKRGRPVRAYMAFPVAFKIQ
jgi:protein TonB